MEILAKRSIGFPQSRLSYKGPWTQTGIQAVSLADQATVLIEFMDLVEDLAYFFEIRGCTDTTFNRMTISHIVRGIAEVVSV